MIVLFLGGLYDGQCMDVPKNVEGSPMLKHFQTFEYQHTEVLTDFRPDKMPHSRPAHYSLVSLMDTDGSIVHVYQCESEESKPTIRMLVEGYRRASD